MRLALLGCDHELQSLLREIPEGSDYTIVAAYDASESQLPLSALLPRVERGTNWESLLVRDDIDLVVVGSPRYLLPTADGMDPQARRVDQLKKLAQAGVYLLVSHPAADLLDAYEIEMLRRDGGGRIQPWFPGINLAAWEELPLLARADCEQIDWERFLPGRTKPDVLSALARDLLLIEQFVGKPRRVTALAGAGFHGEENPHAWGSLTVQVECGSGQLVRWSVARNMNDLSARLHFVGATQNRRELLIPREQDFRQAAEVFAFAGGELGTPQSSEDWLAACHSLETLAAVEKSLQRGRTIELSQAEQTEEHQFKGVMASAGCLLLLLILFAVFMVALVEGLQLPLRNSPLWRLWPLALVIPLAGFLGLQFLQMIIRKSEAR